MHIKMIQPRSPGCSYSKNIYYTHRHYVQNNEHIYLVFIFSYFSSVYFLV